MRREAARRVARQGAGPGAPRGRRSADVAPRKRLVLYVSRVRFCVLNSEFDTAVSATSISGSSSYKRTVFRIRKKCVMSARAATRRQVAPGVLSPAAHSLTLSWAEREAKGRRDRGPWHTAKRDASRSVAQLEPYNNWPKFLEGPTLNARESRKGREEDFHPSHGCRQLARDDCTQDGRATHVRLHLTRQCSSDYARGACH